MSKPMILAYWNTRSIGEPLRSMLEYLEIKFEDKRYPVGDAPPHETPEWDKDKFSMGFDFPNLPYLIDEDVKISESWAIHKYLARKSKSLNPTTEKEIISCDMLEGFLEEFRWSFFKLCYFSDKDSFPGNLEQFKTKLALKFSQIETFMGNNTWVTGENLMYVDFVLFETLDQIKMFSKDQPCYNLEDYPKLKAYMTRFLELDNIARYRKSDRFHARPVHNKIAYWPGKE